MEALFKVTCLRCNKSRDLYNNTRMNYDPIKGEYLNWKEDILVSGYSAGGYGELEVECPCGNEIEQTE